jgi:tellurite resistance protein
MPNARSARADRSRDWLCFDSRSIVLPTRQEEIEKIAALALGPLVEVAWADGHVTPGERAGVQEAARSLGLDQRSEFCRSTLQRWLTEPPPTQALVEWRRLLAPTLAGSGSRPARKSERRLLDETITIAKMDERPFDEGVSLAASAGITEEEQAVLDELAAALERLE